MRLSGSPKLLAALIALGGWQSSTFAQCAADGPIADRPTLDTILGSNQTLEDFETYVVADGNFANIIPPILDSTTVVNGQGPGLVEPGATYSSGVRLGAIGNGYFNRTTRLLGAFDDNVLHVEFDPPVQAMGTDYSGYENYPFTGELRVYDTGNNLVGTVALQINTGGPERHFAGWQHAAGIGRVEFIDFNNSFAPKMDDHGYGDCDDARFDFYCDVTDGHSNNTATIKPSGNVLSNPPIVICMNGGPPAQFGYLLIGNGNGIVNTPPGAKGDLCVVGGSCLGRYGKDVGMIDSSGQHCTDIFSSASGGANYGIPSCGGNIQPGDTWYFQYWHRQPMGQPATFSQAVGITFKP